MSDEEILGKLLELNLERAREGGTPAEREK
jgi:hypothetical protein